MDNQELKPSTSFDLIWEWTAKAEKNCRAQGRNDAAQLWADAREWLAYLNTRAEPAVTDEARKAALDDDATAMLGNNDDEDIVAIPMKVSTYKTMRSALIALSRAPMGQYLHQDAFVELQFISDNMHFGRDWTSASERERMDESIRIIRSYMHSLTAPDPAEKLAEALRHIKNGCLVPPDGDSPCIQDYIDTATEALAAYEASKGGAE